MKSQKSILLGLTFIVVVILLIPALSYYNYRELIDYGKFSIGGVTHLDSDIHYEFYANGKLYKAYDPGWVTKSYKNSPKQFGKYVVIYLERNPNICNIILDLPIDENNKKLSINTEKAKSYIRWWH